MLRKRYKLRVCLISLFIFALSAVWADEAETLKLPEGRLVWLAEVLVDIDDIDSNWDIYHRETPDGETLRLTLDPAWDWGPALSPEGDRLAWLSVRDGQEDIYLADIVDGELADIRRLTDNPHREGYLAWGPRGEYVYYAALDYDGTCKFEFYDLYRVALEDYGPERLTGRPGMHFAPCWLGRRLYYAWRQDYSQSGYLLVELVDGLPRWVLVDGAPVELVEYDDYSPAPPRAVGAEYLAVVRRAGDEARLSVLDPVAGCVIREAVIDPETVRYPQALDGEGRIYVYATASGEKSELALGRLADDGFTEIERLTDDGHFDGYPCWIGADERED